MLPEKRAWVHQCWSGDAVNAQYYLPEGETIENIGYWYPPDGGGIVGSDAIAVLRSATKPVLAHAFLDYLLDADPRRRELLLARLPAAADLARPRPRRRRGVRPAPPGDGGRPSAGLRDRPAAAAADARRRAGVGQRLVVDVHGGRLTSTTRRRERRGDCGRPSRRPACCGSSPCSWSPSTACWRSPSAVSTRSSATPCRSGTRCGGASTPSATSSSGSSRQSSARCSSRTAVYVGAALLICFLIGYPVAYYVARFAGRRRGLLLALLLAPFWINYLMRMLAWVNLLQSDGYVNDVTAAVGLGRVNWLDGRAFTVVIGLVYGYVPFLVLPAVRRPRPHRRPRARGVARPRDGTGGDVPAGDAADVAPGDARRGGDHGAADDGRLLHGRSAVGLAAHEHDRQPDRVLPVLRVAEGGGRVARDHPLGAAARGDVLLPAVRRPGGAGRCDEAIGVVVGGPVAATGLPRHGDVALRRCGRSCRC